MNGRTRVKGQLPGDKAVTNRGTGKGLRGEGQQNTGSCQSSRTVALGCFASTLVNFGFQKIGGDKQALAPTFTSESQKVQHLLIPTPIFEGDEFILVFEF